jgi:hypothetical protein
MSVVKVAHIRVPNDLDQTRALGVLGDDSTASDCAALVVGARLTNLVGGREGTETQVAMMQMLEIEWEFANAKDDAEGVAATMRQCIGVGQCVRFACPSSTKRAHGKARPIRANLQHPVWACGQKRRCC